MFSTFDIVWVRTMSVSEMPMRRVVICGYRNLLAYESERPTNGVRHFYSHDMGDCELIAFER